MTDNSRRKNIVILCVLCASSLFLLLTGGKLRYLSCPFKSLTGIPCPGCGGVRSALSLIRGDIAGAFGYNFLAPFLVLFFIISGFWLLYDIVKNKNTFLEQMSRKWSRTTVIIILCLIALSWLCNIIGGI